MNLAVNYSSRESILTSINYIAQEFSNNIQLKINDAIYQVVDFEFYIYSQSFPDPHTYKHSLQLQALKFYFHGSGLDITIGDGTNCCGMLLRSVVKIKIGAGGLNNSEVTQIDGPQKVATEILSQINNLAGDGINTIRLINSDAQQQGLQRLSAATVLKSKRVGLTYKAADPDNYYLTIPLRYIVVLKAVDNFKQSIKGVESIVKDKLNNGEFDEAKAKYILGYSLKGL